MYKFFFFFKLLEIYATPTTRPSPSDCTHKRTLYMRSYFLLLLFFFFFENEHGKLLGLTSPINLYNLTLSMTVLLSTLNKLVKSNLNTQNHLLSF